jgi:hypothetical protein
MCEHWRKIAKKTKNSRLVRVLEGELGKVGKTRKQKVLLIFILAVLAGLFFSVLFGGNAAAKRVVQVKSPNLFEMDPLEKVGKGFVKEVEVEKVCLETEARKKEEEVKRDEKKEKYLNLIEDHPMERMIEPLLEKDENVSAFLIGIAKKESDWGKHSPKKTVGNVSTIGGIRASTTRRLPDILVLIRLSRRWMWWAEGLRISSAKKSTRRSE